MRVTITEWIHKVLGSFINEGDHCIDATMGKGGDTVFLCKKVGIAGKVWAFDIQKEALELTKARLTKHELSAELILDGHEHIGTYFQEGTISCIMFNLGYLPGGDHSLATRPETTIRAVQESLNLLKTGGVLSICIYSGKDSGFEERDQVLDYLQTLDDKKYFIIRQDFMNKGNHPPMPVFLIKL